MCRLETNIPAQPPPPRGEGREDGFSRLDEGKGGGQLPIANPLANFLVNSPNERLKTVVKIHGEGILCGVKEPFELRSTTNAFAIPPPLPGKLSTDNFGRTLTPDNFPLNPGQLPKMGIYRGENHDNFGWTGLPDHFLSPPLDNVSLP